MNKRDQKELDKRLENPEFLELYEQLIALKFFNKPFVSTALLPKAGDIAKGDSPFIAVIRQPGEKRKEVIAKANHYIREATWLATRLAKYFPSPHRDDWQDIFITQAMGGNTTVEQYQRGGRPKKGASNETKNRYKNLADMYNKASESDPYLTQDEFCREMKISRSKLNRAIKFVSKNRL